MRPASAAFLAGLGCILWLGPLGGPVAWAQQQAAHAVEATDAAEERYELLAVELTAVLAELMAEPAADAVLLVELEELGAVAEEILIEGDAETAVLLLEEALSLLPARGEE